MDNCSLIEVYLSVRLLQTMYGTYKYSYHPIDASKLRTMHDHDAR